MTNPIIKKELYLLKGSILAGIGLMVLIWISNAWIGPYLLPSNFWAVGLMALLLSHITTSAFGHEISDGFFGGYISQPHTRKKLWIQKLTPSLTVYLAVSLILSSVLIWNETERPEYYKTTNIFTLLPCIIAACLGPGIFYNLKFRNPVASLWLTVTSIPVLCVLIEWSGTLLIPIRWQTDVGIFTGLQIWAWGFFFLYGAWGFVAAYRLFLRWEDLETDGKSLDIRFRKSKNKTVSETSSSIHKPSPVRKYIQNELRTQQFNILIGILMVVAIWGTHYWALHRSESAHPNNETQKMIEMLPSMFRYMLFLLPCSIAALSIADNRRQDVITWELMLPLSRHTKWGIKFVTCLLLSWIFTVGLAWTYDSRILFSSVQPESKTIIFYVLSIAAIVIGSLSFYISSLTSSYLKSFSFSLGLLPIMAFFLGFIHLLNREEKGGGFPIGFFAVPTGIILVLSLCALCWSLTNFTTPNIFKQHSRLNWKRWGWSFLVISVCVGIMIDRSWERITLVEEASDPSKMLTANNIKTDSWSKDHLFTHESKFGSPISNQKVRPKLGDSLNSTCIALHQDGRMYLTDIYPLVRWGHRYNETPLSRKVTIPILLKKGIQEGVDFVSPAIVTATDATFYHRFILDTEGQLFMWDQRAENKFTTSGSPASVPIPLTPLGKGQQFRNLCATGGAFYVIDKFDNLWGAQYEKNGGRYTTKLTNFESLFPEETWKEISNAPVGVFARKNDGTLWTWGNGHIYLGLPKEQRPDRTQLAQIFQNIKWKSLHPHSNNLLLEAEDGSLWIPNSGLFSYEQRQVRGKKQDTIPFRFLCKIDIPDLVHYWLPDYDTHKRTPFYWISKKGELFSADLTFENLDPNSGEDLIAKPKNVHQIGHRNDWVYLTESAGMTADGKIWNWNRIQSNRWNPFPARFRHKVVADVGP